MTSSVDISHVDLGQLISQSHRLKRRGNWYFGACPKCGGDAFKSDRFYVKSDKGYFKCRGCGFSGDALTWVSSQQGLDLNTASGFKTACEVLNVPIVTVATATATVTMGDWNDEAIIFDTQYQQRAAAFVGAAQDALWSNEGAKAFVWLLERGLRHEVLAAWGIGYNPEDRYENWSDKLEKPVWLPRGIVIPWEHGGVDQFHRINIRRPVGTPKYISPKGWANSLYGAHLISEDVNVVLVEGEFDALLIHGLTKVRKAANVVAVATGTVTGSRLARWVDLLSTARRVYTAFDRERVGYEAHLWWQAALGDDKVHRLRPTHHDITDMWLAGGNLAVENWLYYGTR